MTHAPADEGAWRRFEAIERDAWLDLYAAAPPAFAAATGLAAARLGPITLLAMRAVPDTQFNRLLGIGAQTPVSEAELDDALARRAAVGSRRFFLNLVPWSRPDSLPAWLAERGLVRYHRPWAKFHRGAAPSAGMDSPLVIRRIGPDRAMDFALPVAAGFGAPPLFQGWLAALPGRPGWGIYVAYDGDRPIAGAALFQQRRQAWLGIDATHPDHRGKGAQKALLARRISDALAGDCREIVAETGVAVAGQPNPSYDNMLRSGLTVAYLRDNYLPADPPT
jgi:hypothetical protein